MTTIDRLVVIGTGLIGGSVALGARAAGLAHRIVGVDADPAAPRARPDVFDAAGMPGDLGADDLVVLAVPTLAVPAVLATLQRGEDGFAGGATVTDVASVKANVIGAAEALPGGAPPNFVPGHPIAGSERSGLTAARAELFRDHRVILTPLATTAGDRVARVRALWEGLGAEVVEMAVSEHDRILALTSHLPHLLAFALVDTLGREAEHEAIFRFAAGGFRDFTRIASSDPLMWADIFSANREAVLAGLDRLLADLATLRTGLEHDDHAALRAVFERAKRLRDDHVVAAPGKESSHDRRR